MADLAAQLVQTHVLTPDAAARAIAAAGDGDVASAALRLGVASESALAKALADFHGCPAVDFSKSVVPTANLDVVAAGFCRQRRILPVSVGRGEMVLAMADPENHALADELRFVSGRNVLRYIAVPAAIERAIDAVAREKARGVLAWRGAQAPGLPDPAAAWVGVVRPASPAQETSEVSGIALPEITSSEMIVVGVAESVEETPFSAPTPARPVRPPEHAPAWQPADDASTTVRLEGVGAGKVVLVADAESEAREEAARLVGELGCAVLQAANGRAALDLVRETRPDLVLLEAMLPMMAGFEVCRAVKGDAVLRPTLVVLTSATHRGTVLADARIAFGSDGVLEKPYRPDDVLRTVKLLLLGGVPHPALAASRAAATAAWREGATLLQAGRIDEAVVRLRDAAAQDDLSAEAHYYLGHALAKQGVLFEAAAAFARSAELRPDVDAAHQVLAQTYEQLGFQKSAREAWARAIDTCKDEPRRRAMQARLMRLLGVA
jgi:CheY-like chemotaxis protein